MDTFRTTHYRFGKKAINAHKNLTKAVKNLLLSSFMLVISRGQTRVGEIKSSYWFVSFHDKIHEKIFVYRNFMIKKDNRLIVHTFEMSF